MAAISANQYECSWCLGPILNQEEVMGYHLNTKTPHYIHLNCGEKWMKQNQECPTCRQEVQKDERDESYLLKSAEESKKQIKVIENQLKAAYQTHKAASKKINEIPPRLGLMKKNNKETNNKIEVLKKELSALEKENTQVQQIVERMNAQNSNLSQQIEEREKAPISFEQKKKMLLQALNQKGPSTGAEIRMTKILIDHIKDGVDQNYLSSALQSAKDNNHKELILALEALILTDS